MAKVTVQAILRAWLIGHGYDGLCTDDCGCYVEDGVCPCGSDPTDCVPGYKVPDPDGESDWIISAEKPEGGE